MERCGLDITPTWFAASKTQRRQSLETTRGFPTAPPSLWQPTAKNNCGLPLEITSDFSATGIFRSGRCPGASSLVRRQGRALGLFGLRLYKFDGIDPLQPLESSRWLAKATAVLTCSSRTAAERFGSEQPLMVCFATTTRVSRRSLRRRRDSLAWRRTTKEIFGPGPMRA